jgi:hypothetical protein
MWLKFCEGSGATRDMLGDDDNESSKKARSPAISSTLVNSHFTFPLWTRAGGHADQASISV